MRTLILSLILILLLSGSPAAAQSSPGAPQPALVLCLPGVALSEMADCSPLGPAAYLNQLARQGMTLPLPPLPAARPDPALPSIPFTYARLTDASTPVYPTRQDAAAQTNAFKTIRAGEGLKYVTYSDIVEENGVKYYLLRSGGWISIEHVTLTNPAVPRFQGLTFSRTPANAFGWIIRLAPSIETKRTPGFETDDYTGRLIYQDEVVQVYGSAMVNGAEWVLVGPEEWIEGRMVGRVFPNTTPPEGVTTGRWIEVNLYEQTLAVYDQSQLVFATLVASGGEGTWTQPGLFQIYKKYENAPMSGAYSADWSDFYFLDDVPYILYYDNARALHGAYWRHNLGYPQSHGCVNLSVGDAHWVFDWAQEGDWVYVHDPSGETPTDPSLYIYGAP